MIEILILAILIKETRTIYKIKQEIKNSFSVFLSASFGSIYPAVKKLEKNGYINAIRKLSSGGQKSSVYSITAKGKEHFSKLMTSEIPETPLFAGSISGIKLMLIDMLDKDLRKISIDSIKKYHEIQLLNAGGLLKNTESLQNKENNLFRKKFLKHHLDKISAEISWLETLNY